MSARRAGSSFLAAVLGALVALVVAAAPCRAAVSVRSEVDAQRVGVDDPVQLTITVEGEVPGEPALPQLTNLDVLNGPFQSTQVSIVNGRVSRSRSSTWLLKPRAVGPAEIGTVSVAGQTAPAIAVQVVAGSVRPPREDRRGADPFGADPFGDPFEELFGRARRRAAPGKLFVEALPSRTRLHVGEPLVLTYALVTQVQAESAQPREAQYSGFWVEDLDAPQPGGEVVSVDGENYRRVRFMRKLLFPTRAGTLQLPPASFRVSLARMGFFDAGGGVERATRPLTISVEPLPDTPGFSGAVGRYRVSAAIDRERLPLGEAATLRFRVEGTGNLKWVERGPDVSAPGVKVYPPQVKSDLRTTPEGIAGSRTWEFVLIPETTGRVEIPPLAFSYYDSAAGCVVTAHSDALPLVVEGGTGASIPSVTARVPDRATGALPLRSDLDQAPAAGVTLTGRMLALLLAATAAAHAVLWGMGRLPRFSGAAAGRRGSRPVRAALRDLQRAAGDGLSKEQAAALVERALHEAFGDVAERDESERARALRALLDDVHFVRYAPQLGDYSDKIRDLAARGIEAVRRWA